MTTIGQLNQFGRINEEDGSTQDASGALVKTTKLFAKGVPVKVRKLRGRELDSAQQINEHITVMLTIRWQKGITEQQQMIVGGHTYNFESIDDLNENKRKYIDILASEVR